MNFINEKDVNGVSIESEKDGLKRRMITPDKKIICECSGTRADLLKCLSTCSTFGLTKESPIIFSSDGPKVLGEFKSSIIDCSECAKKGLKRIFDIRSNKV